MSKNVFADVIDKMQNTDPHRKVSTPSMSNFSVILGILILIFLAIVFIFFI